MDTATHEHSLLFAQFGSRIQKLLDRSRSILMEAPEEGIQSFVSRVPEKLSEHEMLRLVFCGQYSAGKSSLLKAMTGRNDIGIGAGITTDSVQAYSWNGIEVVDTPGIHTELRPDHDEKSYRAIAEADLLMFVITNELMDETIAGNFRTLAIGKDKGHEMMLVVNKMCRAQKGNSPEAHQVIIQDLRKVLTPFTPEQMRICFTDAELALQSQQESNREYAREDWVDSGMPKFLESCNQFIQENGLIVRFTTVLYELEQVLREAHAKATSSGDRRQDGLKELLLQKRRTIHETRQRTHQKGKNKIGLTISQVRNEGHKTAELIGSDTDVEDINQEIEQAQQRVDQYTQNLEQALMNVFENELQTLEKNLDTLANSELAMILKSHLDSLVSKIPLDTLTAGKVQQVAEETANLGKFLVKHSFDPTKRTFGGLLKFRRYSGTHMHKLVKTVGKWFGKSFKPWEAIKYTRMIANAGRVLSVAGSVISVITMIKQDQNEAKHREEIRQAREGVMCGFNDAAHSIEMHYNEGVQSFVSEYLDPEIQEVNRQIDELNQVEKQTSILQTALAEALNDTETLLREIHSLSPKRSF